MAKIIYWKSQLDQNQKIVYKTTETTIRGLLKELDLENVPLNFKINGVVPEHINLSWTIKETDTIEITRPVLGNSSESKNTLATIISIAAVIAATVLSAGGFLYIAAGVGIVGQVAAGALRYRAAKLAIRQGSLSKSEADVETNNFSLTAANNESRPLQPVALPMGSIRMAPDFINQPYQSFFGGVLSGAQARQVFKYYRESPFVPSTWSVTIPAGYITSSPYNWPAYPLKLHPAYVLSDLADLVTAGIQKDFAPQLFPGVPSSPSLPVIVYHGDPADPDFGKISNWALFTIQGTLSATQPQAITDYRAWFDNSVPFPSWSVSETGNIAFRNDFRWQISNRKIVDYINASPGTPLRDSVYSAIRSYMTGELNLGGTSYPITFFGGMRFETTVVNEVYDYSPSLAATHLFNFGMGDLVVSDRRVEKTLVSEIVNAEFVEIDKTDWSMDSTFKSAYSRDVTTLEGATLNNNDDFEGPEFYISGNDFNTYNFIYRNTPKGTGLVQIDFQGQVYRLSNTGLQENSVTFEIQYRPVDATTWDYSQYVHFFSSSTLVVRKTAQIILTGFLEDEFEFRFRKVEKDTTNNNGEYVAQFDVVAFKCFKEEINDNYMAQTIEGLFLVANTQTSGSSNKYTAQVDTKCWVYDSLLDEWNWETTRNPAWWFLYFARGGFRNPEADGTFVFPWSPTYGWVNGPGHPDSVEIMFGAGMQDSQIDIETIKDWAEFCDDQNLFIDIVFKDDLSEFEILEKIASIGRASVSYYKGLLGVVYEDQDQIPVGLYGMGNILSGSFTAEYFVANVPGRVKGTFVDRNNEWETKEVLADVPFAASDNFSEISASLDGITNETQAQREVNILAARQYFQKRIYSWKVDKEGLVAKRGDLVYLSHDSTQFGFSGRVIRFLHNGLGVINGVETTNKFEDNDITHVTIRKPNGDLTIYLCHVENNNVIFDEPYLVSDASFYLDAETENAISDFANSYPEDFIFIAAPMATPGKIVRISQIQPDEDFNFQITAVDEDPAMWSYEFGPLASSESFDDSYVVTRVFNVGYKKLSPGVVKVYWEIEGGDYVRIINQATGLPLSANTLTSFSGGEVTIALSPGLKYNLTIQPFVIGSPYKSLSQNLIVWS
jgi:hypothetical protein